MSAHAPTPLQIGDTLVSVGKAVFSRFRGLKWSGPAPSPKPLKIPFRNTNLQRFSPSNLLWFLWLLLSDLLWLHWEPPLRSTCHTASSSCLGPQRNSTPLKQGPQVSSLGLCPLLTHSGSSTNSPFGPILALGWGMTQPSHAKVRSACFCPVGQVPAWTASGIQQAPSLFGLPQHPVSHIPVLPWQALCCRSGSSLGRKDSETCAIDASGEIVLHRRRGVGFVSGTTDTPRSQ